MNKKELPKLDSIQFCPKCGKCTTRLDEQGYNTPRADATYAYERGWDGLRAKIKRTCNICSYEWDEQCADAD